MQIHDEDNWSPCFDLRHSEEARVGSRVQNIEQPACWQVLEHTDQCLIDQLCLQKLFDFKSLLDRMKPLFVFVVSNLVWHFKVPKC